MQRYNPQRHVPGRFAVVLCLVLAIACSDTSVTQTQVGVANEASTDAAATSDAGSMMGTELDSSEAVTTDTGLEGDSQDALDADLLDDAPQDTGDLDVSASEDTLQVEDSSFMADTSEMEMLDSEDLDTSADEDVNTPSPFPDTLGEGLWLIGWHGGLEHFSWFRFDFVDDSRGSVEVRDPAVMINVPFLACEGTGLFIAEAENNTLVLQAPACEGDVMSFRLGWGTPEAAPSWLSSATIAVPLTPLDGEGPALVAYLFPLEMCDESFRSCMNPFQ